MKNKTLTKNMPYVKWQSIPPVKGPDSQGISIKPSKNTKLTLNTGSLKTFDVSRIYEPP